MPQVRIDKSAHYTTIDNKLIQDPDISLKAKGLLIYMLSVPSDWDYSISGLSTMCKEGKSSIRSAIDELMAHRYVTRSLVRAENGTISGYEYVVYEVPQPSCGFPTTDNPSSENRTQQINNLTNNKKTNTPYSPPDSPEDCPGDGAPAEPEPADKPEQKKPKAKRSRRDRSEPDHSPEAFETFWAAYPRKDGRKKAIEAWDKLKPGQELCRVMYTALKRQCRSAQWAEDGGRYIPFFSTWLNQRRWENQGVDMSLVQAPKPRSSTGGWADGPEVTS